MMSGDNKQDLQDFCIFTLSNKKYVNDVVDEAFRVIPVSPWTGPCMVTPDSEISNFFLVLDANARYQTLAMR